MCMYITPLKLALFVLFAMGSGQTKLTLEEQLRENKRAINRSIRELDRERMALDRQEQQLVRDIKNAAGKDQMSSVKIMAKDLVRIRRHKEKFYQMRSQLQAVNLRLQTVKSTQAMSDSMKGVSKVMIKMNKEMDLPAMQQIMVEFMRESERLGLTEEMMNDVVDDAVNEPTDEMEQDRVIKQVLDEIGVDLSGQLASAPTSHIGEQVAAAAKVPVAAGGNSRHSTDGGRMMEMEKSLEDRLNELRR
eukprot:GHVS01045092.1.p1 GENE.GHVS01045092.1~~GHVS01045092.1.p1  ORF type:complete len:247 (+),score=48.22 GHVS01045092.1:3-743(+)